MGESEEKEERGDKEEEKRMEVESEQRSRGLPFACRGLWDISSALLGCRLGGWGVSLRSKGGSWASLLGWRCLRWPVGIILGPFLGYLGAVSGSLGGIFGASWKPVEEEEEEEEVGGEGMRRIEEGHVCASGGGREIRERRKEEDAQGDGDEDGAKAVRVCEAVAPCRFVRRSRFRLKP